MPRARPPWGDTSPPTRPLKLQHPFLQRRSSMRADQDWRTQTEDCYGPAADSAARALHVPFPDFVASLAVPSQHFPELADLAPPKLLASDLMDTPGVGKERRYGWDGGRSGAQ